MRRTQPSGHGDLESVPVVRVGTRSPARPEAHQDELWRSESSGRENPVGSLSRREAPSGFADTRAPFPARPTNPNDLGGSITPWRCPMRNLGPQPRKFQLQGLPVLLT